MKRHIIISYYVVESKGRVKVTIDVHGTFQKNDMRFGGERSK